MVITGLAGFHCRNCFAPIIRFLDKEAVIYEDFF